MHLDAKSWYSFHDGVASPAELCAQAAELGFDSLGIADTDGTYGLIHCYKAALKCGIKPILGLALTDDGGSGQETGNREQQTGNETVARPSLAVNTLAGRDARSTENDGRATSMNGSPTTSLATSHSRTTGVPGIHPAKGGAAGGDNAATVSTPAAVVIAADRTGYSQLCTLAAWRHGCLEEIGMEPASGKRKIWQLHKLLENMDRCYIISDREDLLRALAPRIGPRRLFVRTDADYGPPARARQIRQLKLARHFRLHSVACTAVRFLRPQDQAVHHVLRAIGQNATLHSVDGVCSRNHYLCAPTELGGYFYDCPEALANTQKIAESCEVDFELGKWLFPDFESPGGDTPQDVLKQLCRRGLNWRYGNSHTERHRTRLEMELKVIEDLGYTSYFLAVHDIVRETKRRRIPWVGRGSAANSIVSYLLGFTPVDPIRYNMYFERFLNPQRKSPPDIDIDFNWKRRDEVINYVYERWGRERVAMISTHVTFRGRSAFREVSKVFGMSDREISTVSKYLPHISAKGLETVQHDFHEMRNIDLTSEPYCHVLPLASRLSGRPRHLGIHCGGVVIAPGRVTNFTGLARAAKGFVVTQYDMFPVEDVGLIKIDLLGNRSLGVLEDTLAVLRKQATGNREQNVGATHASPNGDNHTHTGDACVAPTAQSTIPAADPAQTLAVINDFDTLTRDPATIAMVRDGLTMGCFYIESPGMRQLLRRLRTQTFLDLTAASSVIRPGVAESGMMQEYIRRVRGQVPQQQTHPLMHEMLPETHGVMIYQEDVIKVAHEVAGMSLADADLLRRAMSGKLRSHGAMNEIREKFLAGCEQNGVDIASALEIWRQMASFAGYSFCKAHSASFATLSFQVAYLKSHHPAVFMAGVLSNGGGFYGARTYLSECERMGLAILPPDVNYSNLEYTAERREQATGNREQQREEQDRRGAACGAKKKEEKNGSGGGPAADQNVGATHASPADGNHTNTGDACVAPTARPTDNNYRPTPSQPNAIRVGLSVLKGLTRSLTERIVAERERRGPFRSLPDFIRRSHPREGDLAALILSGALDSLGLSRPELMWLARIEHKAGIRSGALQRKTQAKPRPLPGRDVPRDTGNAGGHSAPPLPLDDSKRIDEFRHRVGTKLDDFDELKLCDLEFEHLGMMVRRHPLTLFANRISGVVNAVDLPRHAERWVRLLGWCIATKRVNLGRRKAIRDVIELQAENSDTPEPAPGAEDPLDAAVTEREGAAEELGIVLGQNRPSQFSSAPGRAMKFMSMEDLTGTFEVTLFADAYAKFAPLTRHQGPFLITGRVEEQFDTYTINATDVRLLRLDEQGSVRFASNGSGDIKLSTERR